MSNSKNLKVKKGTENKKLLDTLIKNAIKIECIERFENKISISDLHEFIKLRNKDKLSILLVEELPDVETLYLLSNNTLFSFEID